MKLADRRIASSSSTICTSFLSDIIFLRLRAHQCEVKFGPAAGARLHPDTSAIVLDDRPADRETESHAFCLGADERRKELLGDLRRHARSGIGDDHADKAALVGTARDGQL